MPRRPLNDRDPMPSRSWTIKALLDVTSGYLHQKGVDAPRLAAEVLLAHLLECRRLDLYLRFDQPLSEEEVSGYRVLVRRRAAREPLQYICGRQEFWSLDFEVGPGVLIPRPETEHVVEHALALHDAGGIPGRGAPRVLDLGTGAGVLAVCIAREVEGARVWASDISTEALERARRNARTHGVERRISWLAGDLFGPFQRAPGKTFDLVVANPPYVAEGDWEALAPEVRDHEPRRALDGGPGGMTLIRRILEEAPRFLSAGGRLLVELDPRQMDEALERVRLSGAYEHAEAVQDHTRRPRVLSAVSGGGAG